MFRPGLPFPACVSECTDEKGPEAWILMTPSTKENMQEFFSGKITEEALLESCRPGEDFEAIYFCSALMLEKYRWKGINQQLLLDAIGKIRRLFPVKIPVSFVRSFIEEGNPYARKLSSLADLTLPVKELSRN